MLYPSSMLRRIRGARIEETNVNAMGTMIKNSRLLFRMYVMLLWDMLILHNDIVTMLLVRDYLTHLESERTATFDMWFKHIGRHIKYVPALLSKVCFVLSSEVVTNNCRVFSVIFLIDRHGQNIFSPVSKLTPNNDHRL